MNVGIGNEAAQLYFLNTYSYISIFGTVINIIMLYINFAIIAVIAAKNVYVTRNRSVKN